MRAPPWYKPFMGPPSGFDILVNGINRTFRDLQQAAHQAAIVLKTKNPTDIVQIRDCATGEVVLLMPDGRLG